MRRKKIRAPSV